MEPELYKRFKNSYKLFSSPDTSCLRDNQWTWSCYRTIRSSFKLPVVHAAAVSKTSQVDEKQDNEQFVQSADKEAKPKIEIEVSDDEVENYIANETGRERLRRMLYKNDKGKNSFEKQFVKDGSIIAGCMVGIYTYMVALRQEKGKFIAHHRATTFQNQFSAVRQQRNMAVKDAARTAFKWGFKTYIFTFMFLGISQTVTVYTNRSTPFEYGISGAMVGTLWRLRQGPKAMFSSGVILGLGGLIVGTLSYFLLHFQEEKQEQRHFKVIKEMLKDKKALTTMMSDRQSKEV